MEPAVIVAISTYRRNAELERLLKSIKKSLTQPYAIVVNDDFGDPATENIVSSNCSRHAYICRKPGPNNCASTGWNRAINEAVRRFGDLATHYLILDDDTVVDPRAIGQLLHGIAESSKSSAVPSVLGDNDTFNPSCMIVENRWEDVKKRCKTRLDVEKEFGEMSCGVWMFQGICHMIESRIIHEGLRFDENFWMLGEDLDLSIRTALANGAVYVPSAFVWHLPGAPINPGNARNSGYLKHCSLIQNFSFMGYWRPYGSKIRGRTFDFLRGKGLWPEYRAFLKTYGVNRHTLFDLLWCMYFGMIKGEASNCGSGHKLRLRRKSFLANSD